jgi:hypothetical protein
MSGASPCRGPKPLLVHILGLILRLLAASPVTTPTGIACSCGLTDTLIGDADGIYHPAMFRNLLDRGEGADFLHLLIPLGAFPRHYACLIEVKPRASIRRRILTADRRRD